MADVDVKALLLQIDASTELLRKNLQAGDAAVAQFHASTTTKLSAMEASFDKLGLNAEGVAKKFDILRGGLEAVGIALSGIAVIEAAKGSLEYAAALKATADRIGVTVEQLQVMRKAARDTGVEQDAMEQGLARLNLRLGQAKAGLPAAVKAFKDIGITPEQLQSLHAGGDALPLVEEGLKKVGDGSTQAAAAQELLSRAALKALPAFTMGKEAYDAMYESAVRSGLITADEATKAHEAQVAIEDLAVAFKTKLAIAISDNIDDVKSLIDQIARLINLIPSLVSRLADARDRIAKLGDAAEDMNNFGLMMGGSITPSQWWERRKQLSADSDQRDRHMNIRDSVRRGVDPIPVGGPFGEDATWIMRQYGPVYHPPGPPPPADHLDLSTHHKPKKQHDDTLERLRAAEEESYKLAKGELDEKKQLLAAQEKLTIDTEDRNNLALQAIDLDHDAKALEIQHNLRMVELDKHLDASKKQQAETEAQKQLALNDQLTLLRRAEVNQAAELERQKQFEQTEQTVLAAKTSYLQLQEGLAQTAAERRRVEQEILDLTYQDKKRALEAIQNDTVPAYDAAGNVIGRQPAHTQDEITRARIEEASLDRNYPLQQQQTLLQTAGPMEQFLRSIPDTAQKATEALQNVEVQGLQSISQGIIDVITGAKSLGQAFHDIANQIISDLLRIAIEKEVIGPLANMLFGGGGGGGGFDAFFNAVNNFGGTFAAGGDPPVGLPSLVGERGPELFIPKVPGTIIPNHALGAGGALTVHISLDNDLLHAQVVNSAGQVVAAAAPTIVAGAHAKTMSTLMRTGING